jgi:hypothetical protein
MVAAVVPSLPQPRPYVVDAIAPIGNGLWQLSVITPDADLVRVTLKFSNLTLQNVILTAEAVGVLYATKNGATPVIHPFR